jgi:nitrous oxide reductase accessory protein NosL
MKKILTLLITLSVVAFAKMEHKHSMHHNMFQTVPQDKAILVQKGKNARYCDKCGMDLVKFYKTSHCAKVNGVQKQFCSIHCLEDAIQSGAKVTDIKVVDTTSLKLIDAKKAYYVVGSNIKGTMSRVSKYAFKNLNDAKKFQKKHGGKIMNFSQALNIAKKDFK